MAVRIRLQRGGRKKAPFYRVGVFDAHTRRQGRMIEKLGFYHPLHTNEDGTTKFEIDEERVKYWLSVGAQPSETVRSLIKKAGIK
ncbi:MAG: 30S ribosomal protein S16 [Planctomycetota bacterium]|nr:MAG: 30S ribosomal protein S16 [Planctomycetota bacterium]